MRSSRRRKVPIGAVLAESLRPLPGLPVEAHEKTVDIFLEGIEDKEALAGGDGLASLASGDKALDEAGQGTEEKQKESFPFQSEPLLKVRCVKDRESGQKVTPVEIEGLADPADALGSGRKLGLWILETGLEDSFKVADVHPARSGGGDIDP